MSCAAPPPAITAKRFAAQRRAYNQRHENREFPVGSQVLVANRSDGGTLSSSCCGLARTRSWSGLGRVTYKVCHSTRRTRAIAHVSRLRAYHSRNREEEPMDPYVPEPEEEGEEAEDAGS